MVERQTPTSAQELFPLHEQGGLTPKHWQEVISRVGRSKGEVPEKIVAYARKVISGEFLDSGFHHRGFLGRRHWCFIVDLDVADMIREPRKILFLLPDRITTVANPIMLEVQEFAKQESQTCYTLDDFLLKDRSWPNVSEYRNVDEWPDEYKLLSSGVWKNKRRVPYIHEEWTKMDHDSGHYFPAADGKLVTIYSYMGEDRELDSSSFFNRWLLSQDEISFDSEEFPKRVSGQSLRQQLIQFAESNPVEIRERLKTATSELSHLHNSPHFGIQEAPIPRAT